jgi:hypothetical protein
MKVDTDVYDTTKHPGIILMTLAFGFLVLLTFTKVG